MVNDEIAVRDGINFHRSNLMTPRFPQRFTIRPRPIDGESLTSYILRLAYINGIRPQHLFRLINSCQKQTLMSILPRQSDINPHTCVDMGALAQLSQLSIKRIERLTLVPFLHKVPFITANDPTARYMEIHHRKFCPLCIHGDRAFKLIWQIHEIKICDLHHVELISECHECGVELKYLGPFLHELKCDSGTHLIYNFEPTTINDSKLIDRQLRLYDDWVQLLNPDIHLLTENEAQEPLKSLAIKLLYLSQADRTEFHPALNVTSLREEYIYRLRKVVTEQFSKKPKRAVTLSILLRTLRDVEVRVNDIRKMDVPDSFVESILEYPRKDQCLTPWCQSFGSSSKIVYNKRIPVKQKKNIVYSRFSMCTTCNIRQGFNTTSQQWESIGGYVEIVQAALQLLGKGCLPYQVRKQLCISQEKMSKIIGYLRRHKLLNNEITTRYTISEIPKQVLISYFKELFEIGGGLLKNARKRFGWSEIEFSFYLAHPSVQQYLFFETKHEKIIPPRITPAYTQDDLSKRVNQAIRILSKSGTRITRHSVGREIGCGATLLGNHGFGPVISAAAEKQKREAREIWEEELIKKACTLFGELRTQTKVTKPEVCTYLGISESTAAKLPRLAEYLAVEFENLRKTLRLNVVEDYKCEARQVIESLYCLRGKVTQEAVAREMGTTSRHLWRYYPEVLDHIRSLIHAIPNI